MTSEVIFSTLLTSLFSTFCPAGGKFIKILYYHSIMMPHPAGFRQCHVDIDAPPGG
ncbi:MAG: hypothetical protein ACLQBD_20640 [Syntrophobacteraceae bacterium]